MFITKEEIKKELKDEDCWKELKPKEKEFFLYYCTNGLDLVSAFKEVYCSEDSSRTVKFPAKKAAEIRAKESFNECYEIYCNILQEYASARTNAHFFNQYFYMATYNVLDFVDEIGAFKFKSIKDAKEILGPKAMALTGLDVTMHPRDPNKTITVPKFCDRAKAMKELAKVTKLFGSEEGAGTGMGQVVINAEMATFNPEDDEKNRRKYNLV